MLNKTRQRTEFNNQLRLKSHQLSRLGELVAGYTADIYACLLVFGFLSAPHLFSDYDFDQLAKMVLALRQIRLGAAPMRVMDNKGNVVCQCPIPEQYIPFKNYGITFDQAKERLAMYLLPVVKDLFIPRSEYLQAKLTQEVAETHEMYRQLTKALSGFPSVPDKSAESLGTSEQKTEETADQSGDVIKTDADASEDSELMQHGLNYISKEAVKARVEMDKKFLDSLS